MPSASEVTLSVPDPMSVRSEEAVIAPVELVPVVEMATSSAAVTVIVPLMVALSRMSATWAPSALIVTES